MKADASTAAVQPALTENQSIYIPLGEVCRLANSDSTPLKIIKAQSGTYPGGNDIVRIEA